MDDLGFVQDVAVIVCRGEAWCGADGASDVFDGTARAADEMVVVVADARFVPCDGSRWVDAPDQAGVAQHPQAVVDGLVGDLAEVRSHEIDDRTGVGVGVFVDCREYGDPRPRDPQGGPAELSLEFGVQHHEQYAT